MEENDFVDGGEKVAACADSGNGSSSGTMHPMAADRLLSVLSEPRVVTTVGTAMPLLSEILMCCGPNSECRMSLRAFALKTGVSNGTAKNWAATLGRLGLIAKKPAGPEGADITLLEPVLRGTSTMAGIREALESVRTAAMALDTVVHQAASNLVVTVDRCTAVIGKGGATRSGESV